VSAMIGVSGQMLRAGGAGLVLCLLGWAAWRLTDLDAAMRRREGLFPRPPRVRRLRRGGRGGDRSGGRSGRGVFRRRVKPPPELLLLPVGLLAAWPTHSPLVAAAAAAAVLPAIRLRRNRRAARARERRRHAVVGLCAALAGELRTGATPHQAAESVSGELTAPGAPLDCTVLLAAVRFGGSVPEAFRVLAELPGAEGAMGIAACWQVASSSGAGLSAGLDRVAEGLRADRALHETVRAELAGPRSTAVLLAALPLFGLLLGAGLGADPLRMLLHTPSGLACLGVGALLECAGIGWTGRIARGAEPAR
jgi:tight adherence protein B